MPAWIPVTHCKRGYIYQVEARNLTPLAVFGDEVFVGIRAKFGSRFLDTELHWDAFNGSCKPLREIGFVPDGMQTTAWLAGNNHVHNDALFEYLDRVALDIDGEWPPTRGSRG